MCNFPRQVTGRTPCVNQKTNTKRLAQEPPLCWVQWPEANQYAHTETVDLSWGATANHVQTSI
eukprot:9639680-Karenia_brevis.AAC.1